MNKTSSIVEKVVSQLVALIQKRPFRFKDTKRADAARYLKQLTAFEGLSEEETAALETVLRVNFPMVFRNYLQRLGKARGDLFKGSEVDPQKFKEYRQWAETLLQENGVPSFLTDTTVIFLFHQGYSFTYLEAEDTFDVPVYLYVEGSSGPQKIASTFSEFLNTEIQRMEHLNQTLYLNGGYVLTVNQQGSKQTFLIRSNPIHPLDSEDRFID